MKDLLGVGGSKMQEQLVAVEQTSVKKPYEAPAVIHLADVAETAGNGGAGFDFASEAEAS
ncbi:MAG TPA: hypothetical protein DCS87_13440 [Rheinheimera sp.]|nr:hypothetical protein [Rheinheimera sp.]